MPKLPNPPIGNRSELTYTGLQALQVGYPTMKDYKRLEGANVSQWQWLLKWLRRLITKEAVYPQYVIS